jgi:outer membrane receptor protein involved in Fe transport
LSDSLADLQATLGATQGQRVFNELRAPDKAETDGVIMKFTGTWTPNDDMLFYATYSQGFRPGTLNRPGGATQGAYTVPFALDTDDVDNFEFGWKTTLADNQIRLNGSAFFVDVSKLQTTIFDPSIVNLFFSDNAANAEIKGVEGDITCAPKYMSGLTVNAAFSVLDSQITEVLTPTDDVRVGDSLAFAPGFQGNLRARYEWETASGLTAHVMPQLVHSGSSFSDIIIINRDMISGWTTLGLSAGLTGDNWSGELYVDNLTNEKFELSRTFINDRERVAYGRPMTIGARVSYNFD